MSKGLSLSEVLDQFARAMRAAGLETNENLVADGQLRRFHVEGDKARTKNGWYVVYADGIPAGEFGSWRTDRVETWRADIGRTITPEEEAELQRQREAAKKRREQERAKVRREARKKAEDLWSKAKQRIRVTHPYVVAKGIKAYGARQLREQLLIPVRNAQGELQGLQHIQPDGSKRFGTGTAKTGSYCAIGKPKDGEVLAIVEGWATGCTVHELTGWPVAVAFDAGNLLPVAKALQEKLPGVHFVVCADNDHSTEGNPGLTKGRATAKHIKGALAWPRFQEGEPLTDWNDFASSRGKEAARMALLESVDLSSDGDGPGSEESEKGFAGESLGEAGAVPAHVEHEPPRSRFELRDDGLYWIGVKVENGKAVELRPQFLCSPLKIEAISRDLRGRNFGRLVSFVDSDNVPKTSLISARALGSSRSDELRGSLLSDGLPLIATDAKANGHLTRYLMGEVPAARARVVTRTGWHGSAFVLPMQTFGNTGGERYCLSDEVGEGSSYERVGTFEAWRDQVSIPAGNHRRVLFALACAFAGPLLEPVGAESGGFHLVGGSSSGKTTALRVAGSVWGSGESFWRQWRATDNGLEAIAEEFGDTLLALDEIGQADPRIVGEMAYMLANGRGKQRARKDAGARAIKSWRVLLLSTGEVGSASMMNEAGKKARAGHEVRLVEIPADTGCGFGLFDSPGESGSASTLSKDLGDGCRANYGHAGPLFVERLARERASITQDARDRVGEFVSSVCPKGADGQVSRVAARFGVVCYAGELATLWELTGWDFEAVRSACVDAFQAWLKRRGTAGAKEPAAMVAQVRAFIEAHGGARFQGIDSEGYTGEEYASKDDPDKLRLGNPDAMNDFERRIINRAGYRKKDTSGRTLYLVFPEVFKKEVCEGFEWQLVCAALVEAGVLVQVERDRYTSKHSTPQSRKRLPFYMLDGDALLEGDS